MQQQSSRPRFRLGSGCLIALLVLLVMGGISVGGYFWARGYFLRQYYEPFYLPIWLDDLPPPAASPASAKLDDVPWRVADAPLSQSLSLQMLAQQYGLDVSRRQADFLMGITYGASSQDGGVTWIPGIDPELGFLTAAPCLGLERRYQVTDDATRYLAALRAELGQGHAVRVALDRALLYDLDALAAHSIVLVGYDASGFRYYEPTCDQAAPCDPHDQPPGATGMHVDNETLLAATRSLSEAMRTPWRYNLMTLTPASTKSCDERAIWRRNGQIMVGGDEHGDIRGAEVIERAAKVLAQQGHKVDQTALAKSLALTAFVRRENAAYLSETWPGEPDALAAMEHLLHAAAIYGQCQDALADGLADDAEAHQLALLLRQAAQAERQAGEAMIDMALE